MAEQDAILVAGLEWSYAQEELDASQDSDYQFALQLQSNEYGSLHQELVDREFTQSVANGMIREHQSQLQADRVAMMAIM